MVEILEEWLPVDQHILDFKIRMDHSDRPVLWTDKRLEERTIILWKSDSA